MKNSNGYTNILGVAVVALAIAGLTAGKVAAGYTMQISFTNFAGRGTLTHFPALVKLTPSNTDSYYGFLNTTDGYDLRFWTNSALTGTALSYEIESFDTRATSYIWVKVPQVSLNSSIWASWGDPAYNSQETYTSNGDVWTEGFVGVWHMTEVNAEDSTANQSTCVGLGNQTEGAMVGAGQDCSGGSLDTQEDALFDLSNDFTLSCWMKDNNSNSGWDGPITKLTKWSSGYQIGQKNSSFAFVAYWSNGWGGDWASSLEPVSGGTWYHVTATISNGVAYTYRNGVLIDTYSGKSGQTINTGNSTLRFGTYDGSVDEVRVVDVVRSPDWIWACWMNQGDNHDGFVAYGLPTVPGGVNWTDRATSNILDTTAWASATVLTNLTQAVLVWDTSDRGTGSTNDWPAANRIGLGPQSAGAVTARMTALDPGTAYVWRLHGTSATTNGWSAPTSFLTLAPPRVDTVGGATGVRAYTATLNGVLSSGAVAEAWICWGTNDMGMANTSDWDHVVSIGEVAQEERFSSVVTGLTPLASYVYRCYAVNEIDSAWSTNATFITSDRNNRMTSAAEASAHNSWNLGGNWTLGGAPAGLEIAIVSAGLQAEVEDDAATPAYSGGLILEAGAGLQIGYDDPPEVAELNALGTGPWILHTGSYIWIRYSESTTHGNPISLLGDAEFGTGIADAAHLDQRTLTGLISGPGKLTVHTSDGNILHLDPSTPGGNTWAGGLLAGGVHSENKRATIEAEKAGALGEGDVTIDDGVTLQLDAADAMSDGATLSLSGDPRSDSAFKLVLNADDTIDTLFINGFAYPASTYGSLASGATNTFAWIDGTGILTVTNAPADSTPPTVSFADDQAGNPVYVMQPITYAVTFDEPVVPDPTSDDLGNAGSAGIVVDAVRKLSDVVFEVDVRATTLGSLQLQIGSGAAFEDLFGNALVTPVSDNTVISVHGPDWVGELGVLKPWANGGINPVTGSAWEIGDQYRLIFLTSENNVRKANTEDLTVYDAYVQGIAAASTVYPDLSNGTWKVIGSSGTVDARDHTGTNPGVDGAGLGIFRTDGSTKVADNNDDLWNYSLDNNITVDENGVGGYTYGNVATGSNPNGTKRDRHLGGSDEVPPKIEYGRCTDRNGAWCLVYNGAASSAYPYYAISEPLTIQAGPLPPPTGLILVVK
jgi:hypothetical protein